MGNPNRDDEVQSNKSFQFSIWKRLFPFAKPYKKLLLLIVITNILISIVDVSLPLFQRYAVDNFIEKGTLDGLPVFIAAYLAVIILQVLSFVFYTLSAMKTEMRMGRDLKRACFVHLQTLSFSYYNTTPVGYILARVMSDTNKIAAITAWDLIDILWALSYVSFAFLSMGNAGSAPCPDGYGDRSGHCSANYLLPEANFVLEPKGSFDQLPHYWSFQRGNHGC